MTLVLYTKEHTFCGGCMATKRELQKYPHVEPVIVAVDDGQPSTEVILKELEADGFLQAPVVKIIDEHGEYVDAWSGFNPDKLREHLGNVRAA